MIVYHFYIVFFISNIFILPIANHIFIPELSKEEVSSSWQRMKALGARVRIRMKDEEGAVLFIVRFVSIILFLSVSLFSEPITAR